MNFEVVTLQLFFKKITCKKSGKYFFYLFILQAFTSRYKNIIFEASNLRLKQTCREGWRLGDESARQMVIYTHVCVRSHVWPYGGHMLTGMLPQWSPPLTPQRDADAGENRAACNLTLQSNVFSRATLNRKLNRCEAN